MSDLLNLGIATSLVLVGIAIVKMEWLPYAALSLAGIIGARFFMSRPRKALLADRYQDFELQEKTIVSPNTAIYRFKLHRVNDTLGLPIGQHITLAGMIDGKEIFRSYTPISSNNERGHFDLLIKSYPTGNISKYVGGLKVGQTAKVKGPKGQMVYRPGLVRAFGMIAGGTGITPMLQIIRAILTNPSDTTQVSLIFANVNEEDILLREDLDGLAQKYSNFKLYYVLNNPPTNWTGGVGFVTADMIKEHLPPPASDMKILLCGPPPMIKAMKQATQSVGYDATKPVSKLADQVFAF